MSLNATLFGQMLTFAFFVWWTLRFIWPSVSQTLEARAQKIADGLAAAELGEEKLKHAKASEQAILGQAHVEAQQIIQHAKTNAEALIAQAQARAKVEFDAKMNEVSQEMDKQFKEQKAKLQTQAIALLRSALKAFAKDSTAIDEQMIQLYLKQQPERNGSGIHC